MTQIVQEIKRLWRSPYFWAGFWAGFWDGFWDGISLGPLRRALIRIVRGRRP